MFGVKSLGVRVTSVPGKFIAYIRKEYLQKKSKKKYLKKFKKQKTCNVEKDI